MGEGIKGAVVGPSTINLMISQTSASLVICITTHNSGIKKTETEMAGHTGNPQGEKLVMHNN